MSDDAPKTPDEEPVPKLPRGRGLALSRPEIIRIGMFLALLFGVIALQRPCAESTARFIGSFEEPPDAGAEQTELPTNFVRLSGEVTEEELRQKVEALRESGAAEPGDGTASPGAPDPAAGGPGGDAPGPAAGGPGGDDTAAPPGVQPDPSTP